MTDTKDITMAEIRQVSFHGCSLETFEHDGEPYVAMRSVCEGMGLSWSRQADKLRGEATKFSCAHMRTTGRDGKEYNMLAIPLRKLPLWMASVNPNKIKDPIRHSRVVLFQEESAIALHDFWTRGVAIRDDAAGLVTDVDPAVMRAIGGMMKGVIGKALKELLPEMVEQRLMADSRRAVVEFVPALEIAKEQGVPPKKRRGLVQRMSASLRRFCNARGFAMRQSAETRRWMFSVDAIDLWLAHFGRDIIRRHMSAVSEAAGPLFTVVDNAETEESK